MTDDRSPPEPPALAAEYALGLLTGSEMLDARRRLTTDPAFAAEVAQWRGRLAPLHAETDEITPPPGLWHRIEALTNSVSINDNVSALRRQLRVWRTAAGGMTVLAACLTLILTLQPRTQVQQPPAAPQAAAPMVAMLGDKGAMKVVASWDPNGRQLILAVPGDLSSDSHHSHELWVIPEDGNPRSLGTMPPGKQMHMQLADTLAELLAQGATIAISVEPRGGSPTGSPTGPVVASGALTRA